MIIKKKHSKRDELEALNSCKSKPVTRRDFLGKVAGAGLTYGVLPSALTMISNRVEAADAETCGDLSPQREFSRHLQKYRDDLEFQEYLDSTEPPVEPSEEELIEWFFH